MMPFNEYRTLRRRLIWRRRLAAIPFAGLGLVGGTFAVIAVVPEAFDVTAAPTEVPLIMYARPACA